MAGVRDPAFWKRFSYAVHLDEERAQRGDLKHSESWLARQQSKKNRRTRICWLFWILFAIIVAGAVIAVIVLINSGVLNNIGKDAEASASASASASSSATASASVMPSATATPTALSGAYRR